MVDSVKDMTTKFRKLDKFEGSDFRRWQKKMHFLLTTLKVAYVLRHILNDMSDALFDVYKNVESAKELWDQLEAKYMAEDTSSKKFLVSNFNNYRMVDSSYFRIEETLRMEESGKGKGKDIAGSSSVNMCGKPGHFKKDCRVKKNNGESSTRCENWLGGLTRVQLVHDVKIRCWLLLLNVEGGSVLHRATVTNQYLDVEMLALKEMVNSMLSYSGLSEGFWGEAMLTAFWGCRAVVRLPEPKKKILGEKGIDCIFIGYAEHSKAYRFYVIEPNDFVSVNSVIESRDAIFDENRFSSIPRPKDIVSSSNGTQGGDLPGETPTEIPKPRLKYIESDVAFWKEVVDDEIGSIMENNTWVLSDLPPGCKPLGCKWIFKRKMKVDGGGAISWASKKQTCITDSTMESEFVALAAAGKEAEWLRNLIYEIPLWPKPISPISIHCDSAATLAKAYSQIYNGKSRHLGVRHNMVRELITNGVISVDFVRSQQNLADHLTKGLARDLVHKSAIGMGLKCKTKRTTYVSMECRRFKKLGLGFLYAHEGYGRKAL
ncbi:hypothetical protein Tco_0071517 [Tanacetum coccineum]